MVVLVVVDVVIVLVMVVDVLLVFVLLVTAINRSLQHGLCEGVEDSRVF